ncbi:MAG: DUF4290 domain-containing protein [Saprospiraceae bacterium]
MEGYQMEYNSAKEELILPEYGRNVQLLIQHAKTIENAGMRQAFVERVIKLMHQMNPQNRSIDEYKDKLWGHVFHIADYDIDVTPDVGDIPTRENARKKPDQIEYPHNDTKYRHYGYNVQKLIEKANAMEEENKRKGFVSAIASYMKLAYKTWNREHYVSDDIIKRDLTNMSNGALEVPDGVYLDGLSNNNNNNSHHSNSSKHKRNKKNNKGGKGSRNNKSNRRK